MICETMPVKADQRYTSSNPCPVCRGHSGLPTGQGRRCWGYSDGEWAICNREQVAGRLSDKGYGYHHRLHGDCNCGVAHGGWVPPVVPARSSGRSNGAYARALWEQAVDAQGTVVETYMKSRGITAPAPAALRFHPSLKHRDSGKVLPAMVVAVTTWPGTYVVAIHHTYLRPDGSTKADVDPDKMSLGPIRGGAVCLGPLAPKMAITEGIEDGMTILQETGMSVCAATSASAMRSMVLPDLPMAAEVVVCSDSDPVGQRAAWVATERCISEDRTVHVAILPLESGISEAGGYSGFRLIFFQASYFSSVKLGSLMYEKVAASFSLTCPHCSNT